MKFLDLLKEQYNEDTSIVEKILQEKYEKTEEIIRAAFEGDYTSKDEAILRIRNEFVNMPPKNIDEIFLKEHMDYIIETINSLNESEIRIVINELPKGFQYPGTPAIEMEGKEKKKRGRPKKTTVIQDPQLAISDENDDNEVVSEKNKDKKEMEEACGKKHKKEDIKEEKKEKKEKEEPKEELEEGMNFKPKSFKFKGEYRGQSIPIDTMINNVKTYLKDITNDEEIQEMIDTLKSWKEEGVESVKYFNDTEIVSGKESEETSEEDESVEEEKKLRWEDIEDLLPEEDDEEEDDEEDDDEEEESVEKEKCKKCETGEEVEEKDDDIEDYEVDEDQVDEEE